MKAANFLHIVQSGDHSLRVPKRQLIVAGETQDDVDVRIAKAVGSFVSQLLRLGDNAPAQ
jgi:hypothetical protein